MEDPFPRLEFISITPAILLSFAAAGTPDPFPVADMPRDVDARVATPRRHIVLDDTPTSARLFREFVTKRGVLVFRILNGLPTTGTALNLTP